MAIMGWSLKGAECSLHGRHFECVKKDSCPQQSHPEITLSEMVFQNSEMIFFVLWKADENKSTYSVGNLVVPSTYFSPYTKTDLRMG